ncbi:MAG: hypothetical protein JWN66_1032 [Sphingomonas bacterium]|nr:hypothetical protein [Sphingomonas bacterium]
MAPDSRPARNALFLRPSLPLIPMAFLLVALALAGGASRIEAPQQIVVRLIATFVLTGVLLPLDFAALSGARRLLWWVAGCYALLMVQLVPLHPSLWAGLPGHGSYARIAVATDTPVWRPLSLTPDLTVDTLLALLPATAALFAALFVPARGWNRLFGWIILIAVASAVFSLIQLATGYPASLTLYRVSTENSATGLFANRNHQAVFLSSVLPILAALAHPRNRGDRPGRFFLPIAAISACLIVTGVIVTGSRMGLIAGALGLVAAILILAGGRDARLPGSTRRRRALAGAAAAGAGLLLAVGGWQAGLFDRLASTDVLAESRVRMLQPLWEAVKAFMPLGSGFGSFDSIFRRFEPLELLSPIYMNQAHNEPMQIAIEGGVPALLLLALLGWWWVSALLGVLRLPSASPSRPLGLGCAAATAILMLASLVDYPLRTPLLGGIFAIACIAMWRASRNSGPEGSTSPFDLV